VIYLFSQIAISLALAVILGGAIGWLVHRTRAAKQIHHLQEIVSRQQAQVTEAQTEVSILSADFDDLKQASESEISTLKSENKAIPALNQNLEKSQLLVRQLMEQHKTELDEINEENEKLLVKTRQTDGQEKEITRLQAELDIERRKSARSEAGNETNESNNIAKNQTRSDSTTSTSKDSKAANSSIDTDDIFADSNDETLPNAEKTKTELAELRDQLAETDPADGKDSASNFVEVSPSLTKPHKLAETQVDDDSLEQMFEPVDQQDDLKQIFGIGPVTEKTLNKLGITAYSQLAELKQHDIEKIADALQIFPGRIERDNWVGGARAQLEEVLEDL